MKNKLFRSFLPIISVLLVGWIGLQDDTFTYSRGKQKITLELENKAKQLHWGQKTKLHFRFENIDPKRLSSAAPGLRFINNPTEKESLFEIVPEKKYLKKDTLNLHVMYREENDSVWVHIFRIPIKN
ncbi:hypothetical protein HUK80_14985 [Flavobacterium sp. MAH-1]|uniref:Uncharacterized protein n=1 Tax=Flavobacterium agri TaxID=2743471 RepID=A0A7Y8Y4E5_9FLAO|nr:hypothetical protein [Flavobacterium agri]NUY82207.1 hypothetical protein [Flavobacterium agri]NYA72231.1 hypothetical protein [Flavobacterium agri]